MIPKNTLKGQKDKPCLYFKLPTVIQKSVSKKGSKKGKIKFGLIVDIWRKKKERLIKNFLEIREKKKRDVQGFFQMLFEAKEIIRIISSISK